MHRISQDPGRIPESLIIDDDHEPETHFVGDSMTAEAIDEFGKRMDEGFADIRAQIKHLGRHSSLDPVSGCEYCEGTHAA